MSELLEIWVPEPIQSSPVDADDVIAASHRAATAFATAHCWTEAIEALRNAKELMLSSRTIYPAATWCKLPLYLQKAGRFQEAMAEFSFLIEDLPRRARKDSRLDDPNVGPLKGKQQYHDLILKSDHEIIMRKQTLAQQREAKLK
ncbi:hypothetical protein [Variovorax atrisoli]|uniref:hypothetical protein n=1 Tax=Variovorax atrisoli TaxID=3394203 RepID=UPI0012FE70D4|nr:hypothetical protein [Variovorax paradoxus]